VQKNGTLTEQIQAKNAIIKTHEDNKAITEEVANDLQNDLNRLNVELNRLRKRPAKCVPVTRSAGRGDEPAAATELSDRDGLSDQWLYEYAGRAEQTRLTLIACQSFINRVKQRSTQND
jgi:predicted nuclease with TOPRIM domain